MNGNRASRNGRPLRVLLLIDCVRLDGGAERFVTGLAAHLPRDRVQPWVCSTRRVEPDALRMLQAAGVPHVNLGRTATWQVHRFGRLVSLLRRERFDVLHANLFGSNLWGTLLGRACRVPVVLSHEHTWSFQGNRLRMWIDGRVIGRLATRCLAVSAPDRERMIALEGIPERKLIVMPYPHIPHAPSKNGGIRSELGLDPGTPVVGVAANLREQKRLDVMLDAHARLLDLVPGTHLVIAGDGPCRQELTRHIDRLGTGSHAHLLGVRSDVDAILREVERGGALLRVRGHTAIHARMHGREGPAGRHGGGWPARHSQGRTQRAVSPTPGRRRARGRTAKGAHR